LLSAVEQKRLQLSKSTEAKKKSLLGQFLTPEKTAAFMADLFPDGKGFCRLLDAGAGIGSLSAAFLDRWRGGGLHFQHVEVDAFELDHAAIPMRSSIRLTRRSTANQRTGWPCAVSASRR
jgi:adenine-specific DNA-methyltransferase